ncbi:MAG: GH3 auxin-responsive promoter family protein, partial [Saprospiraceae bacterium]
MRPRSLINTGISYYLSYLYDYLQGAEKDIHVHQDKMLRSFIQKARKTEVGKQFGFSTIRNYKDFTSQVPIRGYEEIRDQIIRMMEGQTNILWP